MKLISKSTFLVALSFALTASAIPSLSPHGYSSQHTSPVPAFAEHRNQAPLGLWKKLRNSVIETVWGVPEHHRASTGSRPASLLSPAPPLLRARYGDDVVLRFSLKSASDAQAIAEASNILFLDIWASSDDWVDIRVAKDVVPSLLGLLPNSLRTAHVPLIHDLAQTVYESYPSVSQHLSDDDRHTFSPSIKPPPEVTNIFFRDYQPFSVIVPWMRLLASMFSSHVRFINIGLSYEGREIPALRVGVHPTNSNVQQEPRKTIVITGGSHAREWISTTTANYVAYSLITAYGKSQAITKMLEEFDWVIVPTMNPDGYVFTWETDRLWRKNRQDTSLPFCHGVDLDRAWGFEWDGESTRSNPCSESYAGDGPFEGFEANQFAEWARNETEQNNVDFVGYLDFHSYSEQILYPYSYSCNPLPPTLENLEELAMGMAKAIRLTNGEQYTVSSACEVNSLASQKKHHLPKFPRLEKAGGSALDWFYHELRVRYSYQIKLRDRGSYGFLLPRDQIVPTGKEIFNGVTIFGKFLLGADAAGLDWNSTFQHSADRPTKSSQESETPHSDDSGKATPQDSEEYVDDEDETLQEPMSWERRRRRR
ncbi:hypothetical protein AJ80_06455 [Polytolypa hystricis UAMH7299]|uniref:Inactive metallocarboxypeptidase ECM14 n=1 Tax=Polytolypa hystricis (strain UAMH7299) TaxID=1447883 RepID=A0A2B7XWB8_POLH7|nr:hypothetical protein AJ80_06455 [Polytolypa hystricis UAMH7299]